MATPAELRLWRSYIGQRVFVTGHAQMFTVDMVLRAVAATPDADKGERWVLVGEMYAEPGWKAIRGITVATVEPRELYITDPRHPDYEAPGRVVHAAKPKPGTGAGR